MPEELACAAGVLGSHQIALPQHTQGTEGDILKVSDRCGDKVERGCEEWGGSLP